eukprot:snap_masked-scaffold_2-processed-gene-20.22-mRNA-1 protein AED:1.00 eAED:1.00 QI:0/-1/0/0/-1/1/1/0/418
MLSELQRKQIERQKVLLGTLKQEYNKLSYACLTAEAKIKHLKEKYIFFNTKLRQIKKAMSQSETAKRKLNYEIELSKAISKFEETTHKQKSMLFLLNRAEELRNKTQNKLNGIESEIKTVKQRQKHEKIKLEGTIQRIRMLKEKLEKQQIEQEKKSNSWRRILESLESEIDEIASLDKQMLEDSIRFEKIKSGIQGDLDSEGEEKLEKKSNQVKRQKSKAERELNVRSITLKEYEDALMELMSRTGLKDIGNFTKIYQEQEMMNQMLKEQLEETTQELNKTKMVTDSLKVKVSNAKKELHGFSNQDIRVQTRRTFEEKQNLIQEEKLKIKKLQAHGLKTHLEMSKAKFALNNLLGLVEKVQVSKIDVANFDLSCGTARKSQHKDILEGSLGNHTRQIIQDSELEEQLKLLGAKLTKIF